MWHSWPSVGTFLNFRNSQPDFLVDSLLMIGPVLYARLADANHPTMEGEHDQIFSSKIRWQTGSTFFAPLPTLEASATASLARSAASAAPLDASPEAPFPLPPHLSKSSLVAKSASAGSCRKKNGIHTYVAKKANELAERLVLGDDHTEPRA